MKKEEDIEDGFMYGEGACNSCRNRREEEEEGLVAC